MSIIFTTGNHYIGYPYVHIYLWRKLYKYTWCMHKWLDLHCSSTWCSWTHLHVGWQWHLRICNLYTRWENASSYPRIWQCHNSRYRVSMPEGNINVVLISILMLPYKNPIDPKPSSRLNTHVSSTASRLNLGILTNFTLYTWKIAQWFSKHSLISKL